MADSIQLFGSGTPAASYIKLRWNLVPWWGEIINADMEENSYTAAGFESI